MGVKERRSRRNISYTRSDQVKCIGEEVVLPDTVVGGGDDEAEVFLALAQDQLGARALSNVLCAPFVVERIAGVVADEADVLGKPDRAPVFALHFEFEVVDRAILLEQALELLPLRRLGVTLLLDIVAFADQFFRAGEAQHARKRGIGRNEDSVRRALEDSFQGVVENGAVFFLRLAQLLLRGLALGVVPHDHLDRWFSFIKERDYSRFYLNG